MECRINVKLNKLSSEVITQMKWMFNKDKYPNNMKKFTIIPKWNMYTIKMNTQNERVIMFKMHEYPNVYTQIYDGYDK